MAEINQQTADKAAPLRRAYNLALRADRSLQGTIVVTFVILPDGTLDQVQLASNDVPDARFVETVLEQVRGWRYPPSESSPTPVRWPMHFELPPRPAAEAATAKEALSVADYVAAGVPDPRRPWSAADMAAAAKALSSIAERNKHDLPRYRGERSGAVFARIIARENLQPFRDSSTAIGERFAGATRFSQWAQAILKSYAFAGFTPADGRSGDLVEVVGMTLRNFVLLDELSGEFARTLDQHDATYATRMAALQRMRVSTYTNAVSTLAMLRDRTTFALADLRRLVSYMDETLPLLLVQWPENLRGTMIAMTDASAGDAALQDLQPALGELARHLHAADVRHPAE